MRPIAYTSACTAAGVPVKKETIKPSNGAYQVQAGVLSISAAAVAVALMA